MNDAEWDEQIDAGLLRCRLMLIGLDSGLLAGYVEIGTQRLEDWANEGEGA